MQIRVLRGQLNALLQPCKDVACIQAGGAAFEAEHGQSIWGCMGIRADETFGSIYNEHLARCIDNEHRDEENKKRCLKIHTEIANCGNLYQFEDVRAFVDRFFSEDAQILFELSEKGQELGHEDYLDGGMP